MRARGCFRCGFATKQEHPRLFGDSALRCLAPARPSSTAVVRSPRSRPPSAPLRFGSRATSLSFAQGSSRALSRPCASFRLWRCASSCRASSRGRCRSGGYGPPSLRLCPARLRHPRGAPLAPLFAVRPPSGGLARRLRRLAPMRCRPPSRYRG